MKYLLACAALALLVGCGQASTDAPAPNEAPAADVEPTPTIPTDAAAGPSGADNMTWQFTANPARPPRLMYASFGSEGMALNLQCENAIAQARLWRDEARATWPFSLTSGGARSDLVGATSGTGEVVVLATLPLTDPVLVNFRNTGRISVIDGDRTETLDAINDQERQAVAAFFTACG